MELNMAGGFMVTSDGPFDISRLIETIGTACAVYEYVEEIADYVLISCNTRYESQLGKPSGDATGSPITTLFPSHVCDQLRDALAECRIHQRTVENELLIGQDGSERLWRCIVSPIAVPVGHKPRIMHTCIDVSENNRLEDKRHLDMERFKAVVQYAHDAIITIDDSENIVLFNEAASRIFGYSNEEIIGSSLAKLIPERFRKKHPDYIIGFTNAQEASRLMHSRAPTLALRKDGSEFTAAITISKTRVAHGTEMTAIVRDISDETSLIEELIIASRQDALTGLYNRRWFGELLNAEISRCRRFDRSFSLLMLDIDDFKKINDTYGHIVGDRALQAFAQRLTGMLREMDVACRWGGEEFVALLPETSIEGALVVAEKIRSETEMARLKHEGVELGFTVSIGIAHFPSGDGSSDSVIDTVDQRLYSAKKAGKNRVVTDHERRDHS
jgi:diguanylate cyclase (GGDEF)-like protein/PAS domain S-box-containing protein